MSSYRYSTRCYCNGCRTHPGDIANFPKYGREHWQGCMCSVCVSTYNEHNARKTCECADCESHRAFLYGKPKQKKSAPVEPKGRKVKVATINLCERCGTMATSQAMGGVQSWDAPNAPMGEAVELCPGCVGDFKRFMSNETVTAPADRPQSYRKPWEAPKSDALSNVSTEDIARALLTRQLEAGDYRDQ